MNVIFLCGIYPEESEGDILKNSKGAVQFAANKFQHNIISGMHLNNIDDVHIISAPFLGAFPQGYKKCKIKGQNYKNKFGNQILSIDFNNVWAIRNLSRKKNLLKSLESLELNNNQPTLILIYSLHTPLVSAAFEYKKNNSNVYISTIVPDLPQYMSLETNQSLIYKLLKRIDAYTLNRKLKAVDNFVFLTEHMNGLVNKEGKSYTIVEGIVNDMDEKMQQTTSKKDIEEFTIVYTGTLNRAYGIMNLIKAVMQNNNSNLKLVICGKGELEDEIRKLSEKNKCIEYLGQITNEAALKIQLEADLLVNPRQNIGEYTKYSFPSKNLEYLRTGKPLLAYKLDGIPDEYDKYIYYVKGNTIDDLSNSINEITSLSKEELQKYGKQGQNFVMENKGSKKTVAKIFSEINKSL